MGSDKGDASGIIDELGEVDEVGDGNGPVWAASLPLRGPPRDRWRVRRCAKTFW